MIVKRPIWDLLSSLLGNWYQLEPRECRLLVRQFFSDWVAEERADLHLECLDPVDPPARLDP